MWVRFRDAYTDTQIGDITSAFDTSEDGFSWRTPQAETETKAILDFSFNKKDWHTVLPNQGQNYSYTYYNAPRITNISPHYGQVKSPNKEYIEITGKYFTCSDPDCKDLWVRFGENENAIFVKGERVSDEKLRVVVPKYTKPDVLTVEATFNGQDFTHDNQTYGFFDPFVLEV